MSRPHRFSEDIYRTMIENAMEMIRIVDLNGVIVFASPSHFQNLGYRPEELVNKNISELVHPDDRDLVVRTLRLAGSIDRTPITNVKLRHRNGTWISIEGSAVILYDKKHRPESVMSVSRDVSQLQRNQEEIRESEERYRRLVDVSPEAIAVHSGGDIVYANRAAAKLIGAQIPADIIGLPVMQFVHPDYREIVVSRIRRIYEQREATDLIEEKFIRLDGTTIDVEVISIPFSYDGKPAVQIVVRDITARKIIDKERNDFLAIASHELKTPITTIKAFTQLLGRYFRQLEDPKASSYLSKMEAQIDNLTSLIQDLLDVSRLQTGKMQYHMEEFDIDALIAEIVDDIALTTDNHTITRRGKARHRVRGDRYRIAQVLINLLSNAIKYTPHGGKITVVSGGRNGQVTVSVTDTGIGIPADKQGQIFHRFFRVHDKKRESYPGLGLGLYISHEIMTRHAGTLSVTSTEGKGSTFTFTLPATKMSPR